MGPIMGMGLGLGINDLALLRRSVSNFTFAIAAGLITSTLYFIITPINDAHSELLARTAPNIYDVLIAFFGGLAGVMAVSSKMKGNVIPGVAIATALMPPLCTAGYGIATLQWNFFFGAFYLFTINTVFIALATFLTIRFLRFPVVNFLDKKAEAKARHSITAIIIITLIPSIYLGFIMVKENRFEKNANDFIEKECRFANEFLLKKSVDPASKLITLTYVGDGISKEEITAVEKKLPESGLGGAKLTIIQGFAWLKEKSEKNNSLQTALRITGEQLKTANEKLDSISLSNAYNNQSFNELQALFPALTHASFSRTYMQSATRDSLVLLAVLTFKKPLSVHDKQRINKLLNIRYEGQNVKVVFD